MLVWVQVKRPKICGNQFLEEHDSAKVGAAHLCAAALHLIFTVEACSGAARGMATWLQGGERDGQPAGSVQADQAAVDDRGHHRQRGLDRRRQRRGYAQHQRRGEGLKHQRLMHLLGTML